MAMSVGRRELRIDLLGPVLIRRPDGLAPLTRAMEIAVLGVLALHAGSAVGVSALIDVLWPEDPPRTATKTLQGYVKRLRSLLGRHEAVLSRAGPGGYSLDVAPDQVDAIRLESTIAEARLQDDDAIRVRRLDAALAEWRGEPFAGCDLDGLEPYRERLIGLRSVARVERVAAEIRLGVTGHTVAGIRALLGEEPTNERLWLHLAGALYRLGNPVAALRAIGEARRELGERVGVALGPELVELERRILDHDNVDAAYDRLGGGVRASAAAPGAVPATPPRVALPRWAGPLIGTERRVDEIAALVDASWPIVTVVGLGGVGKTRCAVEAARRAATPCRGFVDASAISTGAELAIHLAGSFGAPGRDDPVAAVAEQVAGPRASVVLDNVEQIADVADVLHQLTERCPSVVWLVTSRSPLGLDEERVVRLDPLDHGTAAGGRSAAAELLIAAAGRRGVLVDEQALPAIEQIGEALGGVPLALELAACQLQHLDATALARSMDDPLSALVDPRQPVTRHRSMRACFELGYGRLGSDAAALLVHVANRPAGVRHDDLATLWRRPTPLNRAIAELVDAGFVVTLADSTGQPRLVQLPLVRAFGRTCPRPDDADAIAAALDRRVVGRVLHSMRATTDTALLEPDLPDLRTMLQLGLDDAAQLERALQVATYLGFYWWSHRITEGRQWLDQLLAVARGRPSMAAPHALYVAVLLDFYVGDVQTALRRLDDEHRLEAGADPVARSRLLSLHAMFDAAADRADVAAARTVEAIELARGAGDDQALGLALGNGGDVAAAAGDLDLARDRYVESIERLRRAGLEWLSAAPHGRLGDLELSSGHTRRARMWYERSITLWSSRELGSGAPQTLAGLARLEIVEGDLEAARRSLDLALATAKRYGSRGEYPWVVLGFAALMACQGDLDAASVLFALGLYHGPRAGLHVRRLVEAELEPYHCKAGGPQDSPDPLAVATSLENVPQLVERLVGP